MSRTTPVTPLLLLAAAALALAGCATPAPEPSPTATQDSAGSGCEQVTVVVDFGVLDEPSVTDCVGAGAATAVLEEAGVTTEGTVDYGDQVVCRVNDQPAPDEEVTVEGQPSFVESCETLNSVAYWALWVKSAPDAEWEYAQEGVSTLELTDGQSVGLVYTAGTDSTPPVG